MSAPRLRRPRRPTRPTVAPLLVGLVAAPALGAGSTVHADPPANTAREATARPAERGLPQTCEQDPFHVDYGPIHEGSLVRLGRHRSVDGNANWDPSMEHYIGRVTAVVAARGLDPQGCPIVEVAVDGGEYVWRVRDLTMVAEAPSNAERSAPEVRLEHGLVPDPQVFEARFPHPTRRANSLEAGCSGWIASQPTFTMVLEDDFPTLTVMTRSAIDAVLVVRTPTNEIVCVDDVDGRDPVLSGRAQAGRYEVYVGTYEPSEVDARFRVAISERATVHAAALDDVSPSAVLPLRRNDDTAPPTRLQPGRVRPSEPASPAPSSRPRERAPGSSPTRSANTR